MSGSSPETHPGGSLPGRPARLFYLFIAYGAAACGIAGAFLPLLPTTPFLLLAVWAAPKGSQRVHDWIYAQPRFKRLLDDWHEQGAVPVGAKWLATAMMLLSWLFLLWRGYHWGLVLFMSLFFCAVGIFLWTRPKPRRGPAPPPAAMAGDSARCRR